MPKFNYVAVDANGKTIKGQTSAENEQVVFHQLQQRKYMVNKVTPVSAMSGDLLAKYRKVNLMALVVFSRQFATMINAGIAISRCLDILANQTEDPVLQPAVVATRQDLLAGQTLTEALSRHPKCFGTLYVSMVKAAEVGGVLDATLDRLATFLEKENEIRHKIKSAMVYPIVVMFFSIIVVVAMMIVVVPEFKKIFDQINVALPLPTVILMGTSDLMQRYWYMLIIVPFGLSIALNKYGQTRSGRWNIDRMKLKLPIVGPLIHKMAISRFARTFATLTNSGVPMMRALDIVADSSGNVVLSNAIMTARASVREGQGVSGPLESSGWFPSMVCRMIDIGEETGRLSDMLNKISDFYDTEVDAAIKGLTSMIEPIMIVVLGILVGFIALSIMMPIFDLQKSLNKHGHH